MIVRQIYNSAGDYFGDALNYLYLKPCRVLATQHNGTLPHV